eukprot:9915202-Alexandrium_andersonii.AAC.1
MSRLRSGQGWKASWAHPWTFSSGLPRRQARSGRGTSAPCRFPPAFAASSVLSSSTMLDAAWKQS